MKLSLFLLLILSLAATAHAEIYTWKDQRGISHYVNSIHDVPERYRKKVVTLDLGIQEKGSSSAAAPQGGTATVQQEQTPQPAPVAVQQSPLPVEQRKMTRKDYRRKRSVISEDE